MNAGAGMSTQLLQIMLQFVNWAEIHYLPEYVPSEEEKHDPALYASNVRHVMAKFLGVPTTEHSYGLFSV